MGRQSGIIIVCFVATHVALVLFALSLSTHYWIHSTSHYHINVTTAANVSIKPQGDNLTTTTTTTTPTPTTPPHNHTVHNHTKFTMFNVTRTCSKGFWKICCDEESAVWYNRTVNHTIEVSEIIKLPVYVVYSNGSKNHSVNWTGCHDIHIMGKNTTGWFRAAMFCSSFGVGKLALATVLLYIFLLVPRFKRSFILVCTKTVMYVVGTAEVVAAILIINMHHHTDPDFGQGYHTALAWSAFVAVTGVCVGAVTAVASIGIAIVVKNASSPYENLAVQT